MNKEGVLELLEHTEQSLVYGFIASYAMSDGKFREKLEAELLPKTGDDENFDRIDYREKAEDCFDFDHGRGRRSYHYDFYEAAYEAASRLDGMLSDASFLAGQGRYADAAGIAMSVAEVIPRNYEDVDDSNGSLGDTFSTAAQRLIDILRHDAVPRIVKKEIYDWAGQEMKETVYADYGFDSLDQIYEAACEQFGDTDEVLADIDRQINEAKNDFRKKEAVLRKIRFMHSRNLDTQDVIRKYIELYDVRRIRFNQLIESGQYDEALTLVQKGIEIANKQGHPETVYSWEESILDIYLKQGVVEKILPQSEKLLLHRSWGDREMYYQILKKYTDAKDWPDTLDRILAPFDKSPHFDGFAAKRMIEHQMWLRLFALCKKGSFMEMVDNEQYLKPYFEKEILEMYREYAEKRALPTDQSAYADVARVLKRMRSFEGGNAIVNQLLEKYRTTYKRRKNMIAELRDV